MANLKEVLEFLKSQTQAGRDAQELEEMEKMRQAGIDARQRYEYSDAGIDAENRRLQKKIAEAQEVYNAPLREVESRQRAETVQAEKDFYQQEEARREAKFRKLRESMGK